VEHMKEFIERFKNKEGQSALVQSRVKVHVRLASSCHSSVSFKHRRYNQNVLSSAPRRLLPRWR
jgi:hypothetical protein